MAGVLYIVSTPIGNLSDITLRAIETLKNSDIILAEDTRTTSILLNKYEIKTKLISYHKFSEKEKAPDIINLILNENNIALVSDAGTPLISDPGNILVEEAIKNNIKIIPIGGISAVTALIQSVKRTDEDFKFLGFMPKEKGLIEKTILNNKFENLIFYESPKRILNTLNIILNTDDKRLISIGRELTKKFEEIKTDRIENFINHYKLNPPKGEFVCLLHKKTTNIEDETLKEKIKLLKNKNYTLKDISTILEITDRAPKNKIKTLFLND